MGNHERVLRALFNPDHVKDGKVLAAAISLTDLCCKGFSVQRMAYVSPELVQNLIDQFLSRLRDRQPRKFEGVARLETRIVRDIFEDDKQVFVVIDTAQHCNVGHASIYLSDTSLSQGHARKLRERLLPLLQERTSVGEAFNN